LIIRKTVSLC